MSKSKESTAKLDNRTVIDNMKKNDKFIGDVLAPFEKELGMKFNKFEKPEDPKFVDPRKKEGLKAKIKKAEKKQQMLQKMDPKSAKKVHWKNAIDKASGAKVKDDPALLKKTLKRKTQEKKKSQKKWADRVDRQNVGAKSRSKGRPKSRSKGRPKSGPKSKSRPKKK